MTVFAKLCNYVANGDKLPGHGSLSLLDFDYFKVLISTVAAKCSHCDHGKAGKASFEKGMLKTSLERAGQVFGWHSTGVEGCCRRSTGHAVQCKQDLHFFFLSCTHLHLLPVRTLIQLGLITPIVNAG